MKACPQASCTGTSVQFEIGHENPAYSVSSLLVEVTSDPLEGTETAPLRQVLLSPVTGTFSWTITFTANGRNSGTSTITVSVREDTFNGQFVERRFSVTVRALAPVFDDSGPARTVVDLKTLLATPTFPYTFLVGHEDPLLADQLVLTAFSSEATILPNNCCEETEALFANGGILLTLAPTTKTFVVGQLTVTAREATIVIRPDAVNFGDLTLTLRLTDGDITTLSPITVTVFGRPQMETFCSYDVLTQDSLQSIADLYGMHWMTLFMLNNHTLQHPDSLVPGTRLSIGRAYIVQKGDSLYSIATRYGTTWQHIKAMNTAVVLDEKNLFEGQLLCLASDLAFVACRTRQ